MEYKDLLIYLLFMIAVLVFLLLYGKLIELVCSFESWLEIRKNRRVAKVLRDTEKISRVKNRKND